MAVNRAPLVAMDRAENPLAAVVVHPTETQEREAVVVAMAEPPRSRTKHPFWM